MGNQVLALPIDADRAWEIDGFDRNGAPYTEFLDSYTFEANVWAGDDQEPLFHPTVTWIDALTARAKLAIAAAQTAGLEPGLYRLDVFVTPPGQRFPLFDGYLELDEAPGLGTAPSVYCTYSDLLKYAPEVAKLAARSDQSKFAEQRHAARLLFESMVLDRYRPQPGRTRRYVDASGLNAGPYLRYADPPAGSTVPTTAEIAADLTANALIVSEDVVRCNALLAAAFVYQAQPGRDNVYQQLGQQAMKDAQAQFEQTTLEFDADSDGTPEIRIDRDATFLT
jgi:hypothetical protein